ncbi:hypothetical protein AVEN_34358-1 [Araneus ventricosus]|uniref:Uncharacterized protein n=1 Tax=Araneus ventricosus TaxID=182803 RepID=A0A4Y2G5Y6_ARAVE|nr:hypothetical protein AVEN_34358-1 [Araneus ventricosus]
MGRHARPTRGCILLSMRGKKQTEWRQLLMESFLAYPRGKEEKKQKLKKGKNSKGDQTLGYLGVVNPVTPKEDVPLRGYEVKRIKIWHTAQRSHQDKITEALPKHNKKENDYD